MLQIPGGHRDPQVGWGMLELLAGRWERGLRAPCCPLPGEGRSRGEELRAGAAGAIPLSSPTPLRPALPAPLPAGDANPTAFPGFGAGKSSGQELCRWKRSCCAPLITALPDEMPVGHRKVAEVALTGHNYYKEKAQGHVSPGGSPAALLSPSPSPSPCPWAPCPTTATLLRPFGHSQSISHGWGTSGAKP